MNILLKYPSRSRPDLFVQRVKEYIDFSSKKHILKWVFSFDDDDYSMQTESIKSFAESKGKVYYNRPLGKINACNANVNENLDGIDIVMLISDDMIPRVSSWDDIIVKQMAEHYPELDGALHLNDGLQGLRLSTLSCMGVNLYKHFGYFYHPDYLSTHCDDEYTQIIWGMRRAVWIPQVIIEHKWVGLNSPDLLHEKNHAIMSRDNQVYQVRRKNNFPKESVVGL